METVVTASYGGRDLPHPQAEQNVPTRWLCYTDDAALEAPEPWELIHEPPRYEHPNMAAKWHKLFALKTVWIDANIEIVSPAFVTEARSFIRDGLALYRHPRRDCIYEEAEASLGAESQGGRYDELPIAEQVAHYERQGHPRHGGLYACGIIACDVADPLGLGAAWLAECERWGYQDQLSFPVVCRRLGISPGVFPHPQITGRNRRYLENPWLRIHPHRRSDSGASGTPSPNGAPTARRRPTSSAPSGFGTAPWSRTGAAGAAGSAP